MPTLTSGQAMELARNYLKLAQAINTFRIEKWDIQTEEQRAALKDLHWQITTYVDELVVLSVSLILEDAEDDLNTIQSITEDISVTIRKIEKVQKVIDIATAVVILGGAIVSKDVRAIGKSILGLVKAWQAKLPSELPAQTASEASPESAADVASALPTPDVEEASDAAAADPQIETGRS